MRADSRLLILALPSAAIFAALVWHSLRALPRRRAAAFWISVLVYGVLRGLGVQRVTAAIGASFPYEIHDPMLAIGGVAAQEIAGWAVVAYLAWWIGWRFSLRAARPYLFLQMAWAALFLGAISWAVEAAAIAARWWHWTVPTASRVFLNVPAIGIVDWFFVAIDFVLPFAVLTAPALAGRPWRFLTLLLFPAHFAAHLLVEPVADAWPVPWLHLVHWLLVLLALWLALRSDVEDRPFAAVRDWIPTAGFAVIALDVTVVHLFVVRQPELLQSVAPAVAIWIAALVPAIGIGVAVAALLAGFAFPSLFVTAAIAPAGALLLWLRQQRMRAVAVTAVAVVAAFAFAFHRNMAAARADLTYRLDAAIGERDRGNLRQATAELDAIARDHPTSHVPFALGGEIDYRTGHLDAARAKLARAVGIKHDYVQGYRLLAAIELQQNRRAEAQAWASRGLEAAAGDLQLRYLAGEPLDAVLADMRTPDVAAGMTALAFEVNDVAGAKRIASTAAARWPRDEQLAQLNARLSAMR